MLMNKFNYIYICNLITYIYVHEYLLAQRTTSTINKC